MFGNKSDGDRVTKAGTSTSNAINIIGEGTVIEGDIKSDGDIRIDGTIKGFVTSRAKLVIGPKGNVDGDVHCKNADISGQISGSIEVTDLLFLKAKAEVDGDIRTQKLVVEAGALFNGTCKMGSAVEVQHEEKPVSKLEKELV
ncbi:MAG: polymer-forming cytoskeletal protein [Bacteroidetes bacterium]|nr:polymer-forming cytoskeletal protein [Bacteroidota bacterium]